MTGNGAHSRFSTCSRIRSSSSLIATTSCEHRRVVRLAARGVRLAQHLLQQEAEPLPHPVRLRGSRSAARKAAMCDAEAATAPRCTSRRSASMAISCASRCSSTDEPVRQLAARPSRSRSRCSTTRSGARTAIRVERRARSPRAARRGSATSRAPSAPRIAEQRHARPRSTIATSSRRRPPAASPRARRRRTPRASAAPCATSSVAAEAVPLLELAELGDVGARSAPRRWARRRAILVALERGRRG